MRVPSNDKSRQLLPTKRGLRCALGAAAATIMAGSIFAIAPAAVAAEPDADTYVLTVNGETQTLEEGETVTFGMQAVQSPGAPGTVAPNAVYPGNGGTIEVTATGGYYYWAVNAPCAEGFGGSFIGTFSTTDLTSGFGGGSEIASGFSGRASTSRLYGHRYSGTLSGAASNFWGQCAWTGPNNTIYKYLG